MLTPQYNSNLSRTNDVFNHSNNHFWQYMQPGYDALDFISCTGTNFLVRANAYQVSFRPAADFAVFLASVASTIPAHGIDWGL